MSTYCPSSVVVMSGLTCGNVGRAQLAMDTAVQDERAPALFQAAADKFQEVSAHGALPSRLLC